jgi:hypothetical protein
MLVTLQWLRNVSGFRICIGGIFMNPCQEFDIPVYCVSIGLEPVPYEVLLLFPQKPHIRTRQWISKGVFNVHAAIIVH